MLLMPFAMLPGCAADISNDEISRYSSIYAFVIKPLQAVTFDVLKVDRLSVVRLLQF